MKSEVDGGSGGSDMICEYIHMDELTIFHRQITVYGPTFTQLHMHFRPQILALHVPYLSNNRLHLQTDPKLLQKLCPR